MPVARVGGLSIVTRCLAARRAVALAPAFDAALLPQWIARHRVTQLSLVPTMLALVLDAHPGWVAARAPAGAAAGRRSGLGQAAGARCRAPAADRHHLRLHRDLLAGRRHALRHALRRGGLRRRPAAARGAAARGRRPHPGPGADAHGRLPGRAAARVRRLVRHRRPRRTRRPGLPAPACAARRPDRHRRRKRLPGRGRAGARSLPRHRSRGRVRRAPTRPGARPWRPHWWPGRSRPATSALLDHIGTAAGAAQAAAPDLLRAQPAAHCGRQARPERPCRPWRRRCGRCARRNAEREAGPAPRGGEGYRRYGPAPPSDLQRGPRPRCATYSPGAALPTASSVCGRR